MANYILGKQLSTDDVKEAKLKTAVDNVSMWLSLPFYIEIKLFLSLMLLTVFMYVHISENNVI